MDHIFCERLVMVVLVFFTNRVPIAAAAAVNAAFPALFAFGDSILDTGNNNHLPSLLKCNYRPYGRDFIGGIPTGRWCDGKVPSDLIAESLGIKQTLPAYRDQNLTVQDLPTGVCFASGGSGLDNLTSSTLGVISMSAQLQMFQEYIGRLTASVGQQQASNIISNSLYLLSAGNNDIAIIYSTLRGLMPFPAYANLLVGWTQSFLKDLYGLGARHVWVLSTLPLGCLPAFRLTAAGRCNELENGRAQQFNTLLSQGVNSTKASLPGFDVDFIDVYTPLRSIINNPLGSGFANAATPCCGTGTLVCTILSQCSTPSTHVFWDLAHPTQRTYETIVSQILQVQRSKLSNSSFASSTLNLVSH